MLGYLKNEKANLSTFDNEGFVHSGDLGTIDQDGWVRITGRIKELIITAGGENIAPIPIEDKFKEEFPCCSNIMLIGEAERFISCLITLKVEINPANGQPKNDLLPEVRDFFKANGIDNISTTEEACASNKVSELI
jgi:long-chain-fatty-acid--CoA ligase ACSBG